MIEIRVIDANDSVQEVALDGDVFFLRMSWTSEGEFWSLGVEDFDRTVVLAGIRVVPDSPLLEMFRHLAVPKGELYAVLMDETRGDFVRSDFVTGTAHLVYVEEGEDATV